MNKKELKNQYKQTLQPMGIYQIRNLANNKVFVGSSMNLDGIFNRHRFELNMGSHSIESLQHDWTELAQGHFSFEVLEELEPRDGLDLAKELEFLENLWLEKLQPFGEKGYNERKKTREERLRMIATNRKIL